MFAASQQVMRNRRRLAVLTALQRKISGKKASSDQFAVAKEHTKRLGEFFDELQVEENRIQREIHEIGQKINKLEQAIQSDRDACKNKVR